MLAAVGRVPLSVVGWPAIRSSPKAAKDGGRDERQLEPAGVVDAPSRASTECWLITILSIVQSDTAAVHSWNRRNVPRRFALLAGFVMVGVWAKALTKCGFETKQAARHPLKRAKARPMSE